MTKREEQIKELLRKNNLLCAPTEKITSDASNRKYLRFNAIQYHLWHPQNNKKSLEKNNLLLQSTLDEKLKFCKNGINEYL